MAGGLIIPENIPGDDLNPSALETVAEKLRRSGSAVLAQAEVAQTSWSTMPASLESPQAPVIYRALVRPTSTAQTIESRFGRVATALDEYAAALRPIKRTFAEIKKEAAAFRATITADERVWLIPHETKAYEHNALAVVSSTSYSTSYSGSSLETVLAYLKGQGESTRVRSGRVQILAHWTESSEHIDKNNVLMDRLADAYTRLQNAEADCANAINRQRELCAVDVEHIEALQLKQSGESTVALPWGSRVDEDRNCGERVWWGIGNAGKEGLEGFGGLFGYNSLIDGWEWDKSWETARQSWAGALTGIGSLLIVSVPPFSILGQAGVPFFKDALTNVQEMGKGLLSWDMWADNPAEAAGRTIVNVGSIFLPGAGTAAAAVKTMASGSRIIGLVDDAAKYGDAALTGVRKADGLGAKLDNLVGDAAGTGVKIERAADANTAFKLPDGSLLHVGTRSPDVAPPASLLDDVVPGRKPPHGDTAPSLHPDTSPGGSPPRSGADGNPGSGSPGAADGGYPSPRGGDGAGAPGGGRYAADTHVGRSSVPDEFSRPVPSQEFFVGAEKAPGPRTPFSTQAGLAANAVYRVEGRGDFYTDSTGKVNYVETVYGGRGNLNPELSKNLLPDTTYVVHPDIPNPIKGVSHAHVFHTDALGRVDLIHTDALALGRADRSQWVQSQVGALGGEGFDGGHMLARFLGGGGEYPNLAPMLRELNQGQGNSYFNLEGQWRKALTDAPDTVIPVTIRKIFDGDGSVPVRFELDYRIGNGRWETEGFFNVR